MHEMGMCEAVVQAVERRADGRRVTGVRVQVGDRHAVDPEVFRTGFAMFAQGGVAEGAEVEVVAVAVTGRCRACGEAGPCAGPLPLCPACGSADVELQGGDELVLESIALATETAAVDSEGR